MEKKFLSLTTSPAWAKKTRPRGLALLMVVGVVLVLSLVSLIYLDFGTQSQQTSHAYLDKERATFLAWSGVEFAKVQIRQWYLGHQPGKRRDVMGKEPTSPATFEEHLGLPWGYVNPDDLKNFDPSIPLETARYPSFKSSEFLLEVPRPTAFPPVSGISSVSPVASQTESPSSTTPGPQAMASLPTTAADSVHPARLIDTPAMAARPVGLSQMVQFDPGTHTVHAFSLQVLDAASMIDINGPSRIQGMSSSGLSPNVVKMLDSLGEILSEEKGLGIQNLGEVIDAAYRKQGPFQTKYILKPFLGKTLSEQERNFDLLQDYITVKAWTDSSVLNPGAYVESSKNTPSWELQLQPGLPVTQARAPVNINTASFPVLYAVLNGLSGYRYLPLEKRVERVALSREEARRLARAIIDERTRLIQDRYVAFSSEDEIESFVEGLDFLSEGQKQLVLANGLPGSRWSYPNLNQVLRQPFGAIDKAHLACSASPSACGYTTEFTVSSGGVYSISSLGRLLHLTQPVAAGRPPEGVVRAESRVDVTLSLFDLYRISTQAQWKESLSASRNVILYPEMDSAFNPATLENYFPQPASYEGMLSVALTNPSLLSPFYSLVYTPRRSSQAEEASGSPQLLLSLHDYTPIVSVPSPCASLLEDGYFLLHRSAYSLPFLSEQVSFNPQGNISPDKGTLTFWIKPSWDGVDTLNESSPRMLFEYGNGLMRSFIYKGRLYFSFLPQTLKTTEGTEQITQNYQLELDTADPDIKSKVQQVMDEMSSKKNDSTFQIDLIAALSAKLGISPEKLSSVVRITSSQPKLGAVEELQQKVLSTLTNYSTSVDISDWEHGTWHYITLGWGKVKLKEDPLSVDLGAAPPTGTPLRLGTFLLRAFG